MYRVLSCVNYTLIYNYVCIDYVPCKSNTLSAISCNPTFKDTSFNILLGIGIPEMLLNLVSCHGFMKKPNSTLILNCQTRMINNYLSKGFSVIKQKKQLSLLPNDVRLRINMINPLDTDYFMVKNKAIYAVANTIKTLHIQKNIYLIYKKRLF